MYNAATDQSRAVNHFLAHYRSSKAATLYANPRIKAAADGARRFIASLPAGSTISALDLIQAAHRGMVEALLLPEYGDVKKVLSPALGMNSHVISVLVSNAKIKLPYASRAKVNDEAVIQAMEVRKQRLTQEQSARTVRDEQAIALWCEGKPSLEVMLTVHPGKVWRSPPTSARAGLFVLMLRKKYGADRVPLRHMQGKMAEQARNSTVVSAQQAAIIARDATAMAQWRSGDHVIKILAYAFPDKSATISKANQYIVQLRKRNGIEQVPHRTKRVANVRDSTSHHQTQNPSQEQDQP